MLSAAPGNRTLTEGVGLFKIFEEPTGYRTRNPPPPPSCGAVPKPAVYYIILKKVLWKFIWKFAMHNIVLDDECHLSDTGSNYVIRQREKQGYTLSIQS